MGNRYSAQNVAAYFIYEFNERNLFINASLLQALLIDVEEKWNKVFGHSAYKEEVTSIEENGYAIKEVYEKYKELQDDHIEIPAKDWYLAYGEFQLVYRTYGIPPFTTLEEQIVQDIIETYIENSLKNVS